MKVYKFQNKKDRIKMIWFSILLPPAFFLFLFNIDLGINNRLIYLIAAIISFSSILYYSKLSSKKIEEVIIDNFTLKIYFFNKSKKPLLFQKIDIDSKVENEKVLFLNKNGESVGFIDKSSVEINEDWNMLIKDISDITLLTKI